MSWDTEPATENQLNYLKLFGHTPEQPLSKQAAHDLLSQFEEDPERCRIRTENQIMESRACEKAYRQECRGNLAYYLHKEYANSLETAHQSELNAREANRIKFWKDAFRADRVETDAEQTLEFYENFGRFMKMPKTEQIKGVLTALDKYSPTWDQDRPTDFFHTIKLNFPELMRATPAATMRR